MMTYFLSFHISTGGVIERGRNVTFITPVQNKKRERESGKKPRENITLYSTILPFVKQGLFFLAN